MYIPGTYLDQNREAASDSAIDEGYDYLLFVDSDSWFVTKKDKPSILDILYDCHKDVVGGVYPLRVGHRHGPCTYDYRPDKGDFKQHEEWPLNKTYKVGGIATGMLLIKVEALKKIPYPRFAFMQCKTPEPKTGHPRRLGEDLSFCVRCHENNIKIYADTHKTIGHVGEKIWTRTDYEMYRLIDKLGFKNLQGLTVG